MIARRHQWSIMVEGRNDCRPQTMRKTGSSRSSCADRREVQFGEIVSGERRPTAYHERMRLIEAASARSRTT